jgi:hypothetical protein
VFFNVSTEATGLCYLELLQMLPTFVLPCFYKGYRFLFWRCVLLSFDRGYLGGFHGDSTVVVTIHIFSNTVGYKIVFLHTNAHSQK